MDRMLRGVWLRAAAVAAAGVMTVACAGCGFLDSTGGSAGTRGTTIPHGYTAPTPRAAAIAFLTAWAGGDLWAAAQTTDSSAEAHAALARFDSDLHPTVLRFEPVPTGDHDKVVQFAATVGLGGAGDWTYTSSLTIVGYEGGWRVRWSAAVIHPDLVNGAHLGVVSLPTEGAAVLDSSGYPLDANSFPSLEKILPKVQKAVPSLPGSTRTGIQMIVDPNTPRRTIATLPLTEALPGPRTTIDSRVQALAEEAIANASGRGGVVVLRSSTGEILAMANNPPNGQNITASMQQPGSTMKIVLTAALLRAGDNAGTLIACPASLTVAERTFVNHDPSITSTGASLEHNFAVSCNTAFVGEGTQKLTPSSLGAEAAGAFGITLNWDIGLHEPREYGSIPDTAGNMALSAENMIGQGKVLMAPLAMASVAATVRTGTFMQPVLLPDAPRVFAAGLAPGVAAQLRQMMRSVVTTGTAKSLRGIPGDVGAKTGTAETGAGTNGWMVAYSGDYAIACEMVNGSADGTAGPVVAAILGGLT